MPDRDIYLVEQDVVGSVLCNPDIIDDVVSIIPDSSYFLDGRNKKIFKAILSLYQKNKSIGINQVAANLARNNSLKKMGGRSFLVEIMNGVVSTASIESDCHLIKENYKKNLIVNRLGEYLRESDNLDSKELMDQLELLLLDLSEHRDTDIKPLGLLATEYIEELQQDQKGDYVETRIKYLNREIVGIFKGDLTIVAAPPSMGKTSFCLDVCLFNAQKGKKSLYFAIDETSRAIVQRAIAHSTGLSGQVLSSWNKNEGQLDKILKRMQELLQKDHIYLCDKAGISISDIRSNVRKFKRHTGLDLVIIDYIQQVRGIKKYDRRDLEVGEISTSLKEIAKENNVAMVAVSQLNREYSKTEIDPQKGKYGFPMPSQLRDSGVLEQDANLILFPFNVMEAIRKRGWTKGHKAYDHECKYYSEYNAERAFIVIAKNKVGRTGCVKCCFKPEKMLFCDEDDLFTDDSTEDCEF